MAARTRSGRSTTSYPATSAVPDVGAMSVVSMRSVVVLPAPLGPSTATSSPGSTSSVMPRTACTVWFLPVTKSFVSPRVLITGPPPGRPFRPPVLTGPTLPGVAVRSCPLSHGILAACSRPPDGSSRSSPCFRRGATGRGTRWPTASASARARCGATWTACASSATPSRQRRAPTAAIASTRRAEPYHLVTWGGRWYLVAYDLEREDWRTFRVDRMTPRTPTGPRFSPRELPSRDVATFIAERFTRPASPVEGEAVLHALARDIAPWAGEQATVEALSDDETAPRCRLVMGSWSWTGLAAQLGMFDVPFDVVGPPEL